MTETSDQNSLDTNISSNDTFLDYCSLDVADGCADALEQK